VTRPGNARLAGVTFLVYIAAGLTRTTGPVLSVVLSLVMVLSAFVLAVTLYRLTCEVDADLALLALTCRVAEGVVGAMFLAWRLALDTADAPLRAVLIGTRNLNILVSATLFAVGSTLFAFLLLRGRIVPAGLGWLGVAASLLLVIALPLQIAGALAAAAVSIVWLPMLAFEVPLAVWFIVKGADTVSGWRGA
jgi:hypothetical protein